MPQRISDSRPSTVTRFGCPTDCARGGPQALARCRKHANRHEPLQETREHQRYNGYERRENNDIGTVLQQIAHSAAPSLRVPAA